MVGRMARPVEAARKPESKMRFGDEMEKVARPSGWNESFRSLSFLPRCGISNLGFRTPSFKILPAAANRATLSCLTLLMAGIYS